MPSLRRSRPDSPVIYALTIDRNRGDVPKRSAPRPVVLIRNSERQTFKRCEQMWWWNFVDLLKPVEEGKALRFGDLIHRALEIHYPPGKKRGLKPWLAFERLYKEQIKDGRERLNMVAEDQGWVDAGELGVAMMRGFYAEFANTDAQYEVLASEQVFQVPLPLTSLQRKFVRSLTGKPVPRCIVVGTMDGLWRPKTGPVRTRLPFIKEYKTSGKALSQVLRALPMDEQAGTYWTFGPPWMWKNGILRRGEYPSHILYTLMLKQKADERPEDEQGRKLNKPTKDALLREYERLGRRLPKHGSGTGKNGAIVVNDLIADLGDRALLLGEISEKQPSQRFLRQPVYRDAAERERMLQRCQTEAVEMILKREGILDIKKNPGPQFQSNCSLCAFRDPCEVHEAGGDWEAVMSALFKKWNPYSAHDMPERW